MNRFHLFTTSDYYPDGGMQDYKGSFETLEAAIGAVQPGRSDRWHVAETQDDGSLIEVEFGETPPRVHHVGL